MSYGSAAMMVESRRTVNPVPMGKRCGFDSHRYHFGGKP